MTFLLASEQPPYAPSWWNPVHIIIEFFSISVLQVFYVTDHTSWDILKNLFTNIFQMWILFIENKICHKYYPHFFYKYYPHLENINFVKKLFKIHFPKVSDHPAA